MAQIASVEKILADLEYDKIPRLTVLNKTDMLSAEDTASLIHRVQLETGTDCLAVSALRRDTLAILVEKTGNMLLRNFSERSQFSNAAAS
jgi:50S ribosomal subunit-associated GTPase HflX